MTTKQWAWSGALALGAIAVLSAPTFAQKPFLDKARKMYQLDAKNGTCNLCHEKKPNEEPGAKNLNSFGKAIQGDAAMKPLLGKKEDFKFSEADIKVLESVLTKLESADSDGDGATNKEELMLGTNPGDAKNTPDKKALAKYRKENGGAAPTPVAPKK